MSSSKSSAPLTTLSCKDMSVSILIDDKPVEMNKVEINGNKATCYIEAIEGKEFTIESRMLNSLSPYDVAFFFSVDGSRVGGLVCRQSEDRVVFRGPYTSATTQQPLVFSKVNLTDNVQTASNDEQFIKNLGTIKIECHRGREVGPSSVHAGGIDSRFSNDRSVNEQSKKANVSHQVGFGETKVVKEKHSVKFDYLDHIAAPSAVFEIKYRSRDLLELEDIVKPLVPVVSAPSSPVKPVIGKKRKSSTRSELKVDNDGAIILSSDSEDDGEAIKKPEVKRVKKEKEANEKKDKAWIEID